MFFLHPKSEKEQESKELTKQYLKYLAISLLTVIVMRAIPALTHRDSYLHDSLENDLKAIANEGRRKNLQIRDLAEKATVDLRKSPIIPSDSILQVMESIKGVGVAKIYAHMINIIQRLLTHHLVDSISIISVLEFLGGIILETNEESLQLKSLQTIMLVLNPSVVILTEDLVGIVWKISLSLQNFKSALVRNTASAALRQLVNITFEKLNQIKDRPDSFEAKVVSSSCMMLFKNIVELISGIHSLWTGEKSKMRIEGVSLLSSIVSIAGFQESSTENWFGELEKALSILKDSLNENIEEGYTGQCIACAVQIIVITQQGFDTLIKFAVYIEQKQYPDWVKISSLEAVGLIFKKPSKIENFASQEMFPKILESLAKASIEIIPIDDSKQGKLKVKLLVEVVNSFIEGFLDYCIRSGISLSEGVVSEKTANLIIGIMWKPMLSCVSQLLQANLNEIQLQSVLNSYQSLVNFTGSLGVTQGRESIISSLSAFAKPNGSQISIKQISCYKTLLNIAHGLHFVLDMKSWHRILNSLLLLDSFLSTTKCEDELLILKSALDNLFTSSSMWPNSSVTEFIGALGQLTLEFMEALSSSDKKLTISKIFGLEKLIFVTQVNISRIVIIWDNVAAYLDCICNSKSSEIRHVGIANLTKLLIKIFKYFVDSPPNTNPETPSKWKNWQKTLFASLHDLANQQESEVYKGIYTILQTCGGQLDTSGWTMLLSILCEIDLSTNSAIGFKCLHLIINDFLQSEDLLNCLSKLVEFISKFAYAKDMTQCISAVGMYWNVADYLGRVGREEEENWWLILGKLKELGQDSRPEVRHSALHSLHVALSTHGSCLSQVLWQRIMENIILFLLQRISSTYFKYATLTQEVPIIENAAFVQTEIQEAPIKRGKKNLQISIPTDLAHPLVSETPKFAGKIEMPKEDKIIVHHSRDTLEKQWEETYHIFTQNLGKLFRTYLSNLEKVDEDVLKTNTVKKNWDLLILRLKEGLHNGTTNIITAVLKAVKELISCPKVNALFFAKWNSSWEIFTTLCNRLQVSNVNIPHKLIIIIIEDLNLIYSSEYKEPYQDKCLHNLYLLLNALLEATKLEATLPNCRLLHEQKEVFDFLEKFSGYLLKNKIQLLSYLRFLLKFCIYDTQDSHSDALCRRALLGLEIIANKEPTCFVAIVNDLLNCYQCLLTLRFNSETLLLMSVTCKGAEPLYYVAGESFLKVLPYIMKLNCWDKMLEVLEQLLLPEEKVLNALGRNALDEMMRTSEKLDIKIIEFIKEHLIPQSMNMQATIQWRLISLLDNGCENYYQQSTNFESPEQESFSSACLSGLFELSKLRQSTQEEEEKKSVAEDPVYLKVAKRTTPVLINRCRELLKKFANEEKMMGIMPLPKNKETELLKLIEMLKKLEIPEGVVEGKGSKGHLKELFLSFCDLIIAKEPEVKEALREVFIEYHNSLV
ncbi:hypothetical protein SteCoe_20288 [Stentor coeruleus]|uniref:Protein MON2 homolog n=1 Tax=Stentor coeruleus TaxID=5963 RepID=A0A1R2BSE3_9CILI|nr:hypothetical protein SteCoe_20288 [Stentor coeruleus]